MKSVKLHSHKLTTNVVHSPHKIAGQKNHDFCPTRNTSKTTALTLLVLPHCIGFIYTHVKSNKKSTAISSTVQQQQHSSISSYYKDKRTRIQNTFFIPKYEYYVNCNEISAENRVIIIMNAYYTNNTAI